MRKRKAQGEIITTVLIILLVLAAIVIVWQVVRGTVSNTANQAGKVANCIDTDLTLNSAKLIAPVGVIPTVSATITKGGNDVAIDGVKVLVTDQAGAVKCNLDWVVTPTKYGSSTQAATACGAADNLVAGTTYLVKIGPKIANNQCEPSATLSVSATLT